MLCNDTRQLVIHQGYGMLSLKYIADTKKTVTDRLLSVHVLLPLSTTIRLYCVTSTLSVLTDPSIGFNTITTDCT
jgi:hypothetical protein